MPASAMPGGGHPLTGEGLPDESLGGHGGESRERETRGVDQVGYHLGTSKRELTAHHALEVDRPKYT